MFKAFTVFFFPAGNSIQVDFEEEPPFFKLSDTHYAATWLLHPNAPKVEMPEALQKRIARMNRKEGV